jgi:hypothetical protein
MEPPEPWDETSYDARAAGVNGGTDAGTVEGDLAVGEKGADGTIQDEREVFRLAQERLGLFGQNGGS